MGRAFGRGNGGELPLDQRGAEPVHELGEPNAADPTEDYVAMYYAGHSAQGRWNDWGFRERDPIGIPFAGVIEVDPTRLGPTVLADIDPTWRTIAPEGNRQGQPTGSVGTAWEAANPGWRSDINFDTTTWEAPTPRGSAWWGPDADTPLYLRKVFTLGGPVTEATLLVGVDDDAIVYVNGTLVASDTAVGIGGMGPINIAPLLRVGQNLIAVKAHDSVRGVGGALRSGGGHGCAGAGSGDGHRHRSRGVGTPQEASVAAGFWCYFAALAGCVAAGVASRSASFCFRNDSEVTSVPSAKRMR